MELSGRLEFRFGEFDLVAGGTVLLRSGNPVVIRPKPLALLEFLIHERHRVVTHDEILSAVWPGVTVSEAALTSALRDLRRALGDEGSVSFYVETQRGRGYRFAHPIVEAFEAEAPATEFVGGGALLRSFGQQLEAARKGRGQVVFVHGEPGIGKTRTSLEVAALAARLGLRVFLGRCLENEGAPPYRPWVQILRALVGARAPASFDATLEPAQCASIETLLGVTPSVSPVGAQDACTRFALFDAIVRVLAGAARERPLLLLIEDLHRADASSLALLKHVVGELPSLPLMLLGTFRDGALDARSDLLRTLAELQPAGTRWALAGLSREGVGALAGALGGSPASPALASALHERTGGNPLFVQEITQALCAAGGFEAPDAGGRVAAIAPEGVLQVIRARIAALPGAVTEVLELASVVGREFELLVVERTQPAPPNLRAALEAGADAGVVSSVGGGIGVFRFPHSLFRDAFYDAIPAARRAALHAAVGHALETLDPLEQDARADALAHHFQQALPAGEAARAFRWAQRAAERALQRAAWEEAEAHFTSAMRAAAVALADRRPARADDAIRTRGALLVALGRARWFRGATAEARQAFQDAVAAARSIRDAELLARAALGYVGRTDATPGVNRAAVALLEEALAALPEGDSALRAEATARLGTELYHAADPTRADALTRAALAMAERIGDPDLLAYTCSCRHFSLLRADVDPRARLPLTERQIELAEREGPNENLALGIQERFLDLFELGDGARLEQCFVAFERVVERIHQPFFVWMLGLYRGLLAFLAGRLDEADRLAHESLAFGQRFQFLNALGAFSGQLFAIRREQSRLSELEPPLRMLLAEQPDMPIHRAGLAAIAAECGRREESADALRFLFESGTVDAFPRDEHFLTAMSLLAPACELAGDPRYARRLYEILRPFAGRVIASAHGATCNGSVAYSLGRLAVTLGDDDAADEHFADARSLFRQLRAPLWLAHNHAAHARALWKRGSPGDREKARALQAEALAGYERFGLPQRVAQVHELGAG